MKVCENCGIEIYTKDGENLCETCDAAEESKAKLKKQRAKSQRQMRDQVMRDCGLTKVRGAMGGTYWE